MEHTKIEMRLEGENYEPLDHRRAGIVMQVASRRLRVERLSNSASGGLWVENLTGHVLLSNWRTYARVRRFPGGCG